MTKALYLIAYDTILERIAEGQYAPGSMLPNEFDLGDSLGVSQGTARKALIKLEQDGIVQRQQGRGTFVTLRTPEDSLFHFFRLRDEGGAQVIPELEDEKIIHRPATRREKELLFGAPDEVFEIARLRSFKGRPLSAETSIVPAPLFPGLKERGPLPNTMYVLFQRAYSCVIIEADEALRADHAGEEMAIRLEVSPQAPVILASRKSRDILGRLVELRECVYVTENVHYSVKMK